MDRDKSEKVLIKDFRDFKAFIRYYKKTIIKYRINIQKVKFLTTILFLSFITLCLAGMQAKVYTMNELVEGELKKVDAAAPSIGEYEMSIQSFITNERSKLSSEGKVKSLYLSDFISRKKQHYEVKFSENYNPYYELIYIDQELYEKINDENVCSNYDDFLITYKKGISFDKYNKIESYNYYLEHTTFEKVDRNSKYNIKAGNMYLIGCFDIIDCEIVSNLNTGEMYNIKTKYYYDVNIEKEEAGNFFEEFLGKTCIFATVDKSLVNDLFGGIDSLNEILTISNSKFTYYEISQQNGEKELNINFLTKTKNKQFGNYYEQLDSLVLETIQYNLDGLDATKITFDYNGLMGLLNN